MSTHKIFSHGEIRKIYWILLILNYDCDSLFISEQVAVLKGHTGLVKGVTWDPVGKYLASQVR